MPRMIFLLALTAALCGCKALDKRVEAERAGWTDEQRAAQAVGAATPIVIPIGF